MSKGSAPSAPDPYQVAQAQQGLNQNTALFNAGVDQPNITTPTGSQSYTWSTNAQGMPQLNENVSLSAPEQQLLGEEQAGQLSMGQTGLGLAQQASASLAGPLGLQTNVSEPTLPSTINTSGVPGIAGSGDLSGFTSQAQNAAYKQQTQYLDPQFSQQQQALDAQLRNSGAQPGSAAYDNAMQDFNLSKNQAYSNAEEQAVGQGLQEQQALYGESANTNQQLFGQSAAEQQAAEQSAAQQFGENLAGAQFGNQAAIEQQQLPLEDYEYAMNGVSPNLPSFGLGGGSSQAQAPNIESAFENQYEGQLAGYNANTASTNTDIGAGASLAAAAIIAL